MKSSASLVTSQESRLSVVRLVCDVPAVAWGFDFEIACASRAVLRTTSGSYSLWIHICIFKLTDAPYQSRLLINRVLNEVGCFWSTIRVLHHTKSKRDKSSGKGGLMEWWEIAEEEMPPRANVSTIPRAIVGSGDIDSSTNFHYIKNRNMPDQSLRKPVSYCLWHYLQSAVTSDAFNLI